MTYSEVIFSRKKGLKKKSDNQILGELEIAMPVIMLQTINWQKLLQKRNNL